VLGRLLVRGEIDAAILALESGLEGLSTIELGRDRFSVAVAPNHRLAKSRRAISPEELAGESVLLLDDWHGLCGLALSFCSRVGAAESNYRATSMPTLVQMTAAGLGVTLLPRLAQATECRQANLAVREIAGDAGYRTLVLGWKRGAAVEPTLRFVGEVPKKTSSAVLGKER